ncbi:MAG: inorganic phosphate transporter [Evtepia sp.]
MSVLLLALLGGVIFVNGWTDAPGAIISPVASGILSFRHAVLLAAICNFFGVLLAVGTGSAVTKTMIDCANLGNQPSPIIAAALLTVILWAVCAWYFGIPTSESHALAAALAGASPLWGSAAQNTAWLKLLIGLFLSTVPAYLIAVFLAQKNVLPDQVSYSTPQILAAAAMAFLHGAQDGQKFIGIFLLMINSAPFVKIPLPILLSCAFLMAVGTLCGGRRIITQVAQKMVVLHPREGFAADLGCTLSLIVSTLLGLPVSTTQSKTAAVLGAGSLTGHVDLSIASSIALAWITTFPICAILGRLLAHLFSVFYFLT